MKVVIAWLKITYEFAPPAEKKPTPPKNHNELFAHLLVPSEEPIAIADDYSHRVTLEWL